MTAYAVWELRLRWIGTHKTLLERLRRSASSLDEGVSIPIEADMLDLVPELLDPYLGSGRDGADEEAARICDEIQRAIKQRGVWVSQNQRKAVTREGVGSG